MATKRGNQRGQRGYTLLEYCAGAAVVATILWTALQSMGTQFTTLTAAIGTWATTRASQISPTGTGK